MSWFLQRGKTQWRGKRRWWKAEWIRPPQQRFVGASREGEWIPPQSLETTTCLKCNVMLFQDLFLELISRNGTRSHVAHVQIHKYRILHSVISVCKQNVVFFFHVFAAVSYLKAAYRIDEKHLQEKKQYRIWQSFNFLLILVTDDLKSFYESVQSQAAGQRMANKQVLKVIFVASTTLVRPLTTQSHEGMFPQLQERERKDAGPQTCLFCNVSQAVINLLSF